MPILEPGVPLREYLDHGETYGVRFECRSCGDNFDSALAEVIARLKASGRGDESTGVRAVGRLAMRPCGRCGALAWETRPVHHPRPPRTGGTKKAPQA